MTVAFKNASKEEQAARIKASQAKHAKMVTDAGYTNPRELHGYISAFKAKNAVQSKSGKPGKHYVLNIFANGQDNWFHIYTYAPGMIKRYDKMAEIKNIDKATKAHILTGTVYYGDNPFSSRKNAIGVGALFFDQSKIDQLEKQQSAPEAQAEPEAPKAEQATASVDDSSLPF